VKFDPGRILATPGALAAFESSGDQPLDFLLKHVNLDPGNLSPEDVQENQRSVENGWRILSAYRLSDGTRIWLITESDRSSTCILLPSEY
jgi:hypothetical protein